MTSFCRSFWAPPGRTLDDLRAGAGDPAFLGSVLDFVMMDDAWVVAFCDAVGLPYTTPMQARMALPGRRPGALDLS
jgi:hypothetical protein